MTGIQGVSLLIIFVVASWFADNIEARWYQYGRYRRPVATTTTTTTTTASTTMVNAVSSRPVSSPCRCCAWMACGQTLGSTYQPLFIDSDFLFLADHIDELCEVDLPAAEQCLEENWRTSTGCGPPSSIITILQRFCRIRPAVEAGRICWASGFQIGMQDCRRDFDLIFWRQGSPVCKVVRNLKSCVRHVMSLTGQCSDQDISVVIGYVRNSTLPLCPEQ